MQAARSWRAKNLRNLHARYSLRFSHYEYQQLEIRVCCRNGHHSAGGQDETESEIAGMSCSLPVQLLYRRVSVSVLQRWHCRWACFYNWGTWWIGFNASPDTMLVSHFGGKHAHGTGEIALSNLDWYTSAMWMPYIWYYASIEGGKSVKQWLCIAVLTGFLLCVVIYIGHGCHWLLGIHYVSLHAMSSMY